TFWSTWSPLSQIQIPELDGFARREEIILSETTVEELEKATQQKKESAEQTATQVLLLSMHQSEGIIETYLKRGKYNIPSIIDRQGNLAELYPVLTFPQHFFLDKKGIVRDIYVGFLNEEELRTRVGRME
ncbi:TlpA family protein disulfide reductase, partial [Patescibacteria group bacterium]